VSHHLQRSPEDLQQLLAWCKIRDTLLGHNFVKKDKKKSLELAAVCKHPDAVWLTKLFAGRDMNTRKDVRQVFLGCENDPRALCFAALIGGSNDELRTAAGLGDAFAQAKMASQSSGEERFRWAENSASRGERDGFYELGGCYKSGIGCEYDVKKAKENYLVAADLGDVTAMLALGWLHDETDSQRLVWFGKAATSGRAWPFLNTMVEQMQNFNSGSGQVKVVFAVGRVLKGHVDNEKRAIFDEKGGFNTLIGPANQALQCYNYQLQSYRKAVDTWTLVGFRYTVVKDVRKMIAEMIWDSRDESKY
jgi:hypothetical protein